MSADPVEIIRLWPDGPPTVIDNMPPEVSYPSKGGNAEGTVMVRNVSDPTLSVFTPAEALRNGVGVIICPGGGWTIHAWTHEGTDLAELLTGLCYTAFLL